MPCNGDYLNPTSREIELRRAARLLRYVLKAHGAKVPAWVNKAAADCWCKEERSVLELCAELGSMSDKEREMIVYDAHDPIARDLADWHEEHLAADEQRKKTEKAERRKQRLTEGIKHKLTPEERKIIGLG